MNLRDVIFDMKRYISTFRIYSLALLLLLSGVAGAQDNAQDHSADLYKFTVEQDILNLKFEGNAAVKIKSASGYEEDIARTPYAAAVLTREEIENSGALTIPEVLRLVPGLFVQQTTNGMYEVYIQGREALPAGEGLRDARSKTVLVMINNTPVNNAFDGGVLWETLPVSLQDVERIEVVQSPSTVFFGRDAASGIINIITRSAESGKIGVSGTSQRSISPSGAHTSYSQASVGAGIRDKFLVRLSGSYNSTRRFQDTDYIYSQNRYVAADSLLFYQSTAAKTNLYGSLGRQDYALNSSVRYTSGEKFTIDAFLSSQHSEAQTIYGGFEELALARRTSSLSLANINGNFYNLHAQVSYMFGSQDLATGYPGYQFDAKRMNARLFYDFNKKNFHIMPGLSYQMNGYDDTAHQSGDSRYPDIISGNKSFNNYGVFLKAAVSLLDDKLTLDGGIRRDVYSINRKTVMNYQAAAGYSLIDKVMVHASYATGTLGNFANEAFDGGTRTNIDGSTWQRTVNPSLTGTQTRNITGGVRVSASDKIQVSAAYFTTTYTGLRSEKTFKDSTGVLTREWINTATKLKRQGVTASLSANVSSKFKVRAFATWQKTTFSDDTTASHKIYTPDYVGGLTATFRTLLDRMTINTSLYMYGAYTMQTDRGAESIASKVIPDLKVSYKFWQEHSVFINARNFTNTSRKEFIYSDKVPALYLVGVNLNF